MRQTRRRPRHNAEASLCEGGAGTQPDVDRLWGYISQHCTGPPLSPAPAPPPSHTHRPAPSRPAELKPLTRRPDIHQYPIRYRQVPTAHSPPRHLPIPDSVFTASSDIILRTEHYEIRRRFRPDPAEMTRHSCHYSSRLSITNATARLSTLQYTADKAVRYVECRYVTRPRVGSPQLHKSPSRHLSSVA